MDFQDYLQKRMQKTYTRQLFTMIPQDLHTCLKRVLMLQFDEEPPYDDILNTLQSFFEKSVALKTPSGPPSCAAVLNSRVEQIDSYVFEWNRTLASRVRIALLAEGNLFENAVEVPLSPNQSVQHSIRSYDISVSSSKSSHVGTPRNNRRHHSEYCPVNRNRISQEQIGLESLIAVGSPNRPKKDINEGA